MISKLPAIKNIKFSQTLKLGMILAFIFVSTNYAFGYDIDMAMDELGVKKNPENLPGTDSWYEGNAKDITNIIQNILTTLTYAASAVAIFMIIWNAFTIVTATGDNDTISKAKKGLTWSFVGLLGIIFAYVIVSTIIMFTYAGEV
ncbi:MAG: pilin [Candidatus Peregrinibacteria bacterium]|nr:pilin [Candidatus Peregrinibacteria bacterium]